MSEKEPQKGKFIFIPEGSDEAYEIDMEILLEDLKERTWWERVKAFFSREKEEPPSLPVTPVENNHVSINDLVCKTLEDLLSTAKWYPKKTNTDPSLVIKVYPLEDDNGWEPVVAIATPSGQAVTLGLSDLLFHYDPEIGDISEEVGRLIHN